MLMWKNAKTSSKSSWSAPPSENTRSNVLLIIMQLQGTWDVQGADWNRGGWSARFRCKEGLQLYGERHTGLINHDLCSCQLKYHQACNHVRSAIQAFSGDFVHMKLAMKYKLYDYDVDPWKASISVEIFRRVEDHLKANVSRTLRWILLALTGALIMTSYNDILGTSSSSSSLSSPSSLLVSFCCR